MVSSAETSQLCISSKCFTHATMKNTKPSVKMSWTSRERLPEGLDSLYPVRQRTMKSKHMEYMNVAEKMVLSVEVMTHDPTAGSHSALRRIPVGTFDLRKSCRQESRTVKKEGPVPEDN
jgi:hypothetical protein